MSFEIKKEIYVLNHFNGKKGYFMTLTGSSLIVGLLAVFRIRIRSDPYHLVRSGSVSGNVDMDPGSAKN